MAILDTGRARWLATCILPYESALRRRLKNWWLPAGVDVDDIVQETYARLATLESTDGIRYPFGYMIQVARSIALLHMRRSKLIPITALEERAKADVPLNRPSPEEEVSDRQQLHLLALAVMQIPEPGRSAFTLRFVHDFSYREVAAQLGISENAAQKLVARCLRSLAVQIGRGGKGGLDPSMSGMTESDNGSDGQRSNPR